MNLAQVYAEGYEYRPVALARFADARVDFQEQFDLMGKVSGNRPIIRTKTQQTLWQILCAATRPLSMAEIYARFEDELSKSEQSGLRHQMVKWTHAKFVMQAGKQMRSKYSLGSLACPKL